MKKITAFLPLVLLILLFPVLYFLKDPIADLASEKLREQAAPETLDAGSVYVDSAFNYVKNGTDYRFTFLEFGAIGCSDCKRMESVLEEIRTKHSAAVHVRFVNVRLPENRVLTNYYGVVVIPTQILLNRQGVEFFRHNGYLSAADLLHEMKGIK